MKIVDEEEFDDEDHAMYKDYKAAKKRHISYSNAEVYTRSFSL